MKDFLTFAVRQLVDYPDRVAVREENQGSARCYWLVLPPSEVGKVIGKHGYTITAIRNLLGAAAARTNERATVEIQEQAPLH